MSQTSLASHTGPMVRITVRRSWSVLAMIRCSTPAPRSKPSRTTYAVIIIATSQNQMKSMIQYLLSHRDRITCRACAFRSARSMRDLAVYQYQKQNGQHGVQTHETDQSEQPVT